MYNIYLRKTDQIKNNLRSNSIFIELNNNLCLTYYMENNRIYFLFKKIDNTALTIDDLWFLIKNIKNIDLIKTIKIDYYLEVNLDSDYKNLNNLVFHNTSSLEELKTHFNEELNYNYNINITLENIIKTELYSEIFKIPLSFYIDRSRYNDYIKNREFIILMKSFLALTDIKKLSQMIYKNHISSIEYLNLEIVKWEKSGTEGIHIFNKNLEMIWEKSGPQLEILIYTRNENPVDWHELSLVLNDLRLNELTWYAECNFNYKKYPTDNEFIFYSNLENCKNGTELKNYISSINKCKIDVITKVGISEWLDYELSDEESETE